MAEYWTDERWQASFAAPSRPILDPLTEYVVIVALIAVAAIGTYTLLGQTLRNQTAGLAMEVSGQGAETAIGQAQASANTSQTNADQRKGLDNYELGNH